MNSLVDLVAGGVNVEAADILAASNLNLRDRLSLSPLHPIPEAGSVPPSAASRVAHSSRQDTASLQVAQFAPAQEAEPSTTPTSELEARAAFAMSTPQASCRQSPGDLLGPLADVGASPLPPSQLILGGTTPRGTAESIALHPHGPVVPPVVDEGHGAGVNSVEEKVALGRMDGHDSRPEHGQAQPGFGPILGFSPDPVSPAPAASPNTISSTERMSSSPCVIISLSQDPDCLEPVFRMTGSPEIPG